MPDPFLLPAADITASGLASLLSAAGLTATVDPDGDVSVVDPSGVRAFVQVDAERPVLTFFSIWELAPADELAQLHLVNKLNGNRLMVRFTLTSPTSMLCDYQLDVEDGLTAATLLRTYRTFVQVCVSAVGEDDGKLIDS